MFIKKLQLKNFKRFSDLTIDLEPHGEEAPKLVLLIGANGSGKSCVFDAFEIANRIMSDEKLIQAFEDLKTETKKGYLSGLGLPDNEYCLKKKDIKVKGKYGFIIDFDKEKRFEFQHESTSETNLIGLLNISTNLEINKYFYGRSAFRYLPRLDLASIGQSNINLAEDHDRPKTLIDIDNRFVSDVNVTFTQMISDFLNEELPAEQRVFLSDTFRVKINQAFERIFKHQKNTNLKYVKFEVPVQGKPLQFLFQKGSSTMHYDLLSAGEKEIVNILFNLFTRTEHFQNAIYYFDELDLHLNTDLQESLLNELMEHWLPKDCQVWAASHSLGFIECARKRTDAVIIDFDDLDFDQKQTLKPANKNDLSIFTTPIPIGSIESLVQLPSIVLCENKDSKYYQSDELGKKFFGVQDKFNVLEWCHSFNAHGIIDGDYLLDSEKADLENKFEGRLKILKYYSVESYLFHPDNLLGENESPEKTDYKQKLIEEKNRVLSQFTAERIVQARSKYGVFVNDRTNNSPQWFINRGDSQEVLKALQSDDFETFYKFLPMKDYCTELSERQNKDKIKLSQTNWCRSQIKDLLK